MTLPRYRRHDPLDVMRYLLQIGPRLPTSVAEAQAAAYVDSRLRRAGLAVGADTFKATAHAGWTGLVYALPALLAVLVLLLDLPVLAAVLLVIYGSLLIVLDAFALPLPSLAPRHDSQNIVAVQACRDSVSDSAPQQPRWRVVLLAPLDTPPTTQGAAVLFGRQPVAHGMRLLCYALLLGLVWAAAPLWMLALPVLLLCIVAVPPAAQSSTSDVFGSSGALAAGLATVAQLPQPATVEVWVVALGASTSDDAGITDLLRRYPFDVSETLLICLPHIGEGDLVQLTQTGLLRQHAADPFLREVFSVIAPGVAVPLGTAVAAAPARFVALLHRRGYRVLALHTRADPEPYIPRDEAMVRLDFANLDPVSRLLIGVIGYLDQQ